MALREEYTRALGFQSRPSHHSEHKGLLLEKVTKSNTITAKCCAAQRDFQALGEGCERLVLRFLLTLKLNRETGPWWDQLLLTCSRALYPFPSHCFYKLNSCLGSHASELQKSP